AEVAERLRSCARTSVFLNRPLVKHSKSTVFPSCSLYLNPYRILYTSNLDAFDCVPPSLVSHPGRSLGVSWPGRLRMKKNGPNCWDKAVSARPRGTLRTFDMTFHRAVAPPLRHRGTHRRLVTADAFGESAKVRV